MCNIQHSNKKSHELHQDAFTWDVYLFSDILNTVNEEWKYSLWIELILQSSLADICSCFKHERNF